MFSRWTVVGVVLVVVAATWFWRDSLTTLRTGISHEPVTKLVGSLKFDVDSSTPSNLFWFMHASDLHVSKFHPEEGAAHLRQLVQESIPAIKPSFVIITGDLTDAKDKEKVKSMQHQSEWETYREITSQAGVHNATFWHDMRGNHDCFNVPSYNSPENFYRTYSTTKEPTFSFVHETPFGKYAFISIDACPEPGPSRPFNFFGLVTRSDLDQLEHHLSETRGANHTLVFGHYPLAMMKSEKSSRSASLAMLLQQATVYSAGHLHTLLGLAEEMYRHVLTFVELEVGDIKQNGKYRVVAIDHDLISFIDVRVDQWPVILITNPKDARILLGQKEPLDRLSQLRHVRLLIFSPNPVTDVTVVFDDQQPFHAHHYNKDSALWLLEWDPSLYNRGVHTIQVTAIDNKGYQNSIRQPFSLDGDRVAFSTLGAWVLALPLDSLLLTTFIMIWLIFVVGFLLIPLLWVWNMQRLGRLEIWWARRRDEILQATHSLSRGWMLPLYLWFPTVLVEFAQHHVWAHRLLLFYGLYLPIGPLYAAELLHDIPGWNNIGIVYLWGLRPNWDSTVWSLDAFFFTCFDFFFFFAPLVLHTAIRRSQLFRRSWFFSATTVRLETTTPLPPSPSASASKPWLIWRISLPVFLVHLLTIIVWFGWYLHVQDSRNMGMAYGFVAILLSPAKMWWSLVTFLILIQYRP